MRTVMVCEELRITTRRRNPEGSSKSSGIGSAGEDSENATHQAEDGVNPVGRKHTTEEEKGRPLSDHCS